MNTEHLESVQAQLLEERSRPEGDRSTCAVDSSLDGVLQDLARAIQLLRDDKVAAGASVMNHVAFHVAESWSYKSALAVTVLEHARAIQKIAAKSAE